MNSNNLTNYSDIFDRTKGNYLLKMKDFTNAKKLFVKSYETNKRLGKFNTQLYSLKRVILSELSKSDTIMPKYFDAYLEMVDTLVDKRLSNNLAEWEVKYQATIKEQEAKLANQKLIIVEANNSKKNAYLLLSFLGMALIGALALLFYRENKRKTQDNQKLQQGIKGLEKLLIDVNHRTKGQFNTTAYFLQTKRRLTTDKNVSVAMMDAENLIHSIITINKYLALDSKSSLQKSTAVIAENMKFGADRLSGKNLKFKLNIPLLKTSDTNNLTVGTIITELITNSIKYAFEAEDKPEIQINMEEHKNGEVSFRYKDNGIGHKIHDITSGKGLAIIDDMVEQLNGSYKTSTVDGFYFESSFPSFIKND